MSGVRLEAKVHVVTCAVNAAQNVEKCVRRCGLEVDDIILEQLASAHAVLTDDEKSWASAGWISAGHHRHLHFHRGRDPPYGGDPDRRRRSPTTSRWPCVRRPSMPGRSRFVMLARWPSWLARARPSRSPALAIALRVNCPGRPAEVVEPRYDELFTPDPAELRRSGYEDLVPAGIVLTGGTAKMEGAVDGRRKSFTCRCALACRTASGTGRRSTQSNLFDGRGLLLYGLHKQADGVPMHGLGNFADESNVCSGSAQGLDPGQF